MICSREAAAMRLTMVRGLGVVAAATWLGGCLDSLGHEEDVIETRVNEGLSSLADDRIEDKTPTFDANRSVTETFGQTAYSACAITMNKSAAVTKLDIVPFEGHETVLDKRLFRGRS